MSGDKNLNALVAKARAIYGRRIKTDEYHNLLHKSTVPQVITALKETDRYRSELALVNEQKAHRGHIEVILAKSVFETYEKLNRFIPTSKNSFNEFYAYKKELSILLDTIMFIHLKQFDSIVAHLPMYMSDFMSFDIETLVKARNFDDLKKALSGTRYGKILNSALPGADYRAGEQLSYEELTITMYTEYYKWLLGRIDAEFGGMARNILHSEILRQINLDNLTMMYRMRRYFNRPPETVKRLIFPIKTNISDEELNVFASDRDGTGKILEYMENTMFNKKTTIDKEFLELSAERDIYRRHSGRLRLEINGSVVLYSLMKLLEIEQNNITTIIEGVRYSLRPAEIEALIVI